MASPLVGGYLYSGIDKPGKYPYINVEQTESGHFIMMDDTPGNETVRIQHGKVVKGPDGLELQTYWKVGPDGSVDQVTAGNNFSVIINNNNVTIGGVCHITVKADAKISVYGDTFAEIGGNIRALVPNGSVNLIAGGEVDIVASQGVNISAGNAASLNPLTAPDINLITGGAVNITGDLQVSGTIRGGASINATTHLTAGFKCFTLGGLETLGGINCGFVTPGPIIPPGVITNTLLITSPSYIGGISAVGIDAAFMQMDYAGAMAIIRTMYNAHNHIAPEGPTTPTLLPDASVGGYSTPGAPPVTI
jgi:hypothetical protein